MCAVDADRRDRLDTNTLELTHDFVAQMLGFAAPA